jgi:hypothetical protein
MIYHARDCYTASPHNDDPRMAQGAFTCGLPANHKRINIASRRPLVDAFLQKNSIQFQTSLTLLKIYLIFHTSQGSLWLRVGYTISFNSPLSVLNLRVNL